ncbi:alpha/beta hydrolase [Paraburkholderia sp. 22099]|jgi:acetyl esterase|uniref:Acetyl esterase n=1 Tax=Paraburkholderia terricola TaxID=169427 RepID=A0ABU1LQX9_9BURK|nr:alpha/beta hydrolase [Paraburkholderia terricola]MDR6409148.1 acetyl esterase [Paraburkholderia terricola]MDR6482589.1 acetyl esterase [Paraburkholderia terricola]MDR6494336.1 acetyl esterase [Paraburkholderia terricola]
MSLAPSVQQFLARRMSAGAQNIDAIELRDARQRFDYYTPLGDVAPRPLAAIEDLTIDTRDHASLDARVYYPAPACWADPQPALLFFHSGGYVVGSVAASDALCRTLAADTGCAVVSVGYRLAPEYRFPYAVNDAIDALRWLHRQAASLAIDATRLAVGGESSGATLATVCAFSARDAGIPLALQLLIYPAVSGGMDTAAHRLYGDGYFLSLDVIRWIQSHYLASADDRRDWRFAPLDGDREAPADWRGLAPAWIVSAQYDPLQDEHARYAEKLELHGNRAEVVYYPGMIHGFFSMGGMIPEAALAHRDAARVLRTALRLP